MWKRACSKHPAQILQESSSFLSLNSKQDSDFGESVLGSCVWEKILLANFKGNSSEALVCVVKQVRDRDKPSSEN